MAFAGSINLKIAASQAGSNDFGTPAWVGSIEQTLNFGSGTTASNIDLVFFDERTVASASNDDIDVAGSLLAPLGSAFVAAELVAIVIVNKPLSGVNTTNLTIGGSSAPITTFLGGTTPTVGPIRPGGMFMIACADAAGIGAITATTADLLRIANSSGAAATYQIAILARSA